jgi:hypothetical protein
MKTALTFGAVLNTEIGADFNEAKAFTKTTIGEMNSFLAWSKVNNVLNCIWVNDKLSNLASYEQGAEIIEPKQADGVSSYSFGGVSLSGLMGIFIVVGFVLKTIKENT